MTPCKRKTSQTKTPTAPFWAIKLFFQAAACIGLQTKTERMQRRKPDVQQLKYMEDLGDFGTSNPSKCNIFAVWYCWHFSSLWKVNLSWRNTWRNMLLSDNITGWSCPYCINLFSSIRKLVSPVVGCVLVSLFSFILHTPIGGNQFRGWEWYFWSFNCGPFKVIRILAMAHNVIFICYLLPDLFHRILHRSQDQGGFWLKFLPAQLPAVHPSPLQCV